MYGGDIYVEGHKAPSALAIAMIAPRHAVPLLQSSTENQGTVLF